MSITELKTEDAPPAIGPYSQGLCLSGAGDLVFISGVIPIDPVTKEVIRGDIEEQTAQVLNNMEAILQAGGLALEDVVKTTVYLADLSLFEAMNCVYGGFFNEPYPARATVEVSRLPKDVSLEIEAIAVRRKDE